MRKFRKKDIAEIAERLGMDSPGGESWQGIDAVLPMLERMREDGAVVIIKLDGERTAPGDNGPYTVLASGGGLPHGEFLRMDAHTLEGGLCYLIGSYAAIAWQPGDDA